MTKKISFTSKPVGTTTGNADDWVANRETQDSEPTKRLTIEVPLSLHKRMKAQCAMQNLAMADVIRELLDKRFPNTSEPGGPS
jgi:hypothetical protein